MKVPSNQTAEALAMEEYLTAAAATLHREMSASAVVLLAAQKQGAKTALVSCAAMAVDVGRDVLETTIVGLRELADELEARLLQAAGE
ncbi:MAG: hypothetical protein ACOYD1_12715 [Candidatus Nanopelagicales bacterium]